MLRLRLDRASEAQPRSEPFVGRARSLSAGRAAWKICLWEVPRFEALPGGRGLERPRHACPELDEGPVLAAVKVRFVRWLAY